MNWLRKSISHNSAVNSLISYWSKKYPIAGPIVSGLRVDDSHIPNTSSISASMDEYRIANGLREIPISDFDNARDIFYAKNDFDRSRLLSEKIRSSGYVVPLIIAVDSIADGPYILEGSHRFVALTYLGVKSFPALLVIDLSVDQKWNENSGRFEDDTENWIQKISSFYTDKPILADPSSVGYKQEWGEHHGPVSYVPDTWNYGELGYYGNSGPMPLPKTLYHVTPFADEIIASGFKTFKDPKQQIFGGHGTYVSFTDFESAKKYQSALKEVVRVLNGKYPVSENNFNSLKVLGQKWGMNDNQIASLIQYINFNYDKEKWSSIDAGLEFVRFMKSYGAKDFPIIFSKCDRLIGKQEKDISILKVTTTPQKWHSGININKDEMHDKYTYNRSENEWRIWNPKSVINIEKIA